MFAAPIAKVVVFLHFEMSHTCIGMYGIKDELFIATL
jgi:hypothetical protein